MMSHNQKITLNHHHYIQYHNTDKLGEYPNPEIKVETRLDEVQLDRSSRYQRWMYTKKKTVQDAIGGRGLLILGKTEQGVKQYVLWASFAIEAVVQEDYCYVEGTGFNLPKPILLNDLYGYDPFKKHCGNFGLGFMQIDGHPFSKTLIQLAQAHAPE